MSDVGKCLEVWDVRTKKMDVRAGKFGYDPVTYASMFWTTKNSTIVAAFSFTGDSPKIIYEFNSSTLKTVGTPFEGHTMVLVDLALSSDDTLLVSGCYETIKLWAFESRHLLASFDVLPLKSLILSPDSRQLAFASGNLIYIYNTPTEILASSGAASDAQTNAHKNLADLLKSDATRRPGAVRRNPVTSPFISYPPRPRSPPTVNSQQSIFVHRLRKFLRLPPRVNAVANDQPRDPLDFPATSALPPNHSLLTQAANLETSPPPRHASGLAQFLRQNLSPRSRPNNEPPEVEVPTSKFTRLAAARLPEYKKVDDTRHPSRQQHAASSAMAANANDPPSESSDRDSLPDVHWFKAFLCYYSCWSHGRLRMPPRWRLERVYPLQQAGSTSGNSGGVHGRN